MKKEQALAHWAGLPADLPILPHWQPIPYKATGSTYGTCGIRIDGNPQFVDAVLSRIKDLIDGENAITRLQLARTEVDGKSLGKSFANAETGAQVCYIRLHERGREAAGMNLAYNVAAAAATKRFYKGAQ